jgi:hypothetical protein
LLPDGEEVPIPYAEYFTRDFFRNAMNYFLATIQPPDRAMDAFHLPIVQEQLRQMAAAILFKYGQFQTQVAFEQYREMGAQAAVTENELDRQTEMNSTACMIMVSAALNQHFADYLNRPIPTDEWPELRLRLVQYFDTAPLLVIDAFYASDDYPTLQLDEGDWEKYFTALEEMYNRHKDQLHGDPFIWSRFFHLEEIQAIQEIGYYRFDREIVPFVENLDGVIAEIERNIPVEKDGEITAVSFPGKTFLSLPVDHYGKDVVFNRDEAGDSSRRCFYACLIEWVMQYGECLVRIDLPLERDEKGNPSKVRIKYYLLENDQGQLSILLIREEIRHPEGE